MVKNYLKVIGVVVLLVAAFFIGRVTVSTLFGGSSTSLPNGLDVGGGAYASDPVFTVTGSSTISGATTLGSAGVAIRNAIFGTTTLCVLGTKGPGNINSSQAATSTVFYDCPVTGARPNDFVMGFISTSTTMGANGWEITQAKASSTNDFIELGLYNGTGAAAVPSASAVGSSTNVLILR